MRLPQRRGSKLLEINFQTVKRSNTQKTFVPKKNYYTSTHKHTEPTIYVNVSRIKDAAQVSGDIIAAIFSFFG